MIVPRREIKEFFVTVTIQQLSIGAINLFEPIFLYQLNIGLKGILLYYLAVYVPYFIIIPFGGKFAKRFGYEHSLATATFVNSLYYICLALIPFVPGFLFVAPLLSAIQKTFWWPAYHANFARFSKEDERGREIGSLNALYTLASAIGPFLGGAILLVGNFTILYAVGVVLMILSVIPLFTTRESFKPSLISWREQMRFVFGRAYRRRLLGGIGYGEEMITQTIWPIYIFVLLGSALNLGAIIGFATILTIIVSIITGRVMDKKREGKINFWSALVLIFSWVLRPFVGVASTIFLADTAARVSKFAMMIPAYSKIYQDGKKTHVMREVMAYEMSLIVGKVAIILALLVLFSFTSSLWLAFWLAVPFSVLYLFFK